MFLDRLSLWAPALAATLAQGCALPPPDVRQQTDLGAIAVVPGTTKPELSFRGLRKAEGAARARGDPTYSLATLRSK
jgi:hypothetical protein